jgi:hypothetical protein
MKWGYWRGLGVKIDHSILNKFRFQHLGKEDVNIMGSWGWNHHASLGGLGLRSAAMAAVTQAYADRGNSLPKVSAESVSRKYFESTNYWQSGAKVTAGG